MPATMPSSESHTQRADTASYLSYPLRSVLGEKLIGARAYRVIFALVSLPLATVAIVYFINHRYDGTALWDLRGLPGVHEFVWILNFISFYFLYPSTFNILEVRLEMLHPSPSYIEQSLV